MSDLDAIHENRMLSRWAALLPRPPSQLGAVHETDSELVSLGDGRVLAINVDSVVEEVRTGLYDPTLAGRIAVISALSDLSAVGAEALGVLMSVTLPPVDTDAVQEGVARGIRVTCEQAGTFVLGGDTNEGPDLAVACVAIGLLPEEHVRMRVGSRGGDSLWASGTLGAGSALAAHALLDVPEAIFGPDDFHPVPRLREGVALRGLVSACMDTSDGLVATLDQMARLNAVRFVVDGPVERLLGGRVAGLQAATGLPALGFVSGHHGEFELVFTLPPGRESALLEAASSIGWTPLRLGHVEPGTGVEIAGIEIDAAKLRNLLTDVGGDPKAYAAELIRLTG